MENFICNLVLLKILKIIAKIAIIAINEILEKKIQWIWEYKNWMHPKKKKLIDLISIESLIVDACVVSQYF